MQIHGIKMEITVMSKIIGTGSALPDWVVNNNDLSLIMDTSDEWIASRTGIRERRLAKEETTAFLSTQAALKAMDSAGITPDEIDLILVGTITGDYVTPAVACEVQAAIGARYAVAFDINAACSGFMYSLFTAHAYLQTGRYHTALVIGAETLSKIMDWNDRNTCVLFGDGAGAAIMVRGDGGILAFDLGTEGDKANILSCRNRLNNNPLITNPINLGYVWMNGQEVYKFAVKMVPISIEKVLKEAGLSVKDISLFLLHQANIRIIQAVAKRLMVEESRFPVNLHRCGNISAASVPILLDESNQQGIIKKGDIIMLCGFGAGMTWGTTIIQW